jgi:hypothetical protein
MSRSTAPFVSPRRVLALALNTLTELSRLKIFYFLLVFALLIIGISSFSSQISVDQSEKLELQMLKDVALGAMSIFTSLIAILATAMLLPKDIEDRTIFTILAKPVPRFEYVAGKLLGILILLAISTLVMSGLFLAMLWFRESSLLAGLASVPLDDPETRQEVEQIAANIRAAAFNDNLLPGILVIYIKAAVLAAITLLVSTFASSAIFTMMISIAIYFIGHLQATAREYWLESAGGTWWSETILALVALIFPDLQAFNLNDEVVAGAAISLDLFLRTAGLGCVYVAVYYAIASFLFSTREL